MALCTKIGGDVEEIGNKVQTVFDVHRKFLWTAAGQPEPTDPTVLKGKITPLIEQLEIVNQFKEDKRQSPNFNHLAAVSEGLQALMWIAIVS